MAYVGVMGGLAEQDTHLLDLCGRIMLTHALDPGLMENALESTADDACDNCRHVAVGRS